MFIFVVINNVTLLSSFLKLVNLKKDYAEVR